MSLKLNENWQLVALCGETDKVSVAMMFLVESELGHSVGVSTFRTSENISLIQKKLAEQKSYKHERLASPVDISKVSAAPYEVRVFSWD